MLDAERLRGIVTKALEQRETWDHLVRHDPAERVCELLVATDEVDLWLVCWSDGHDTGFHDHDHSAGHVTVVAGSVREERLVLLDDPISTVYGEGDSVDVPPGDIHRVVHAGERPAVTLHAYSPPLERVGTYERGEDGRLRRLAAPADRLLVSEDALS